MEKLVLRQFRILARFSAIFDDSFEFSFLGLSQDANVSKFFPFDRELERMFRNLSRETKDVSNDMRIECGIRGMFRISRHFIFDTKGLLPDGSNPWPGEYYSKKFEIISEFYIRYANRSRRLLLPETNWETFAKTRVRMDKFESITKLSFST